MADHSSSPDVPAQQTITVKRARAATTAGSSAATPTPSGHRRGASISIAASAHATSSTVPTDAATPTNTSTASAPAPTPPQADLVFPILPAAVTTQLHQYNTQPVMETDLTAYTEERVERNVKYAMSRIFGARQPSPRTKLALILFHRTCSQALAAGLTEERRREIQDMEKDFGNNTWLTRMLGPEAYAMMDELRQLRFNQILALVGDFVKIPCTQLREGAPKAKIPNAHLFGGKTKWTDVARTLEDEQKIFNDCGSGDISRIQTFWAVRDACISLKLPLDDTLLCIKTYGLRNEVFHNDIEELLADGKVNSIARIVHNVLEQLYSCVPVEHFDHGEQLRKYFSNMRDTWFGYQDANDADTWYPKPDLLDQVKQRAKKTPATTPAGTPKPPATSSARKASTTPSKKPNESQHWPKAKEQVYTRTEYLSQPLPPLAEYRLPSITQLAPERDYVGLGKRALSENADPSGREAKRSRAQAWASIVVGVQDAQNREEKVENDAKNIEMLREGLKVTIQTAEGYKEYHDRHSRQLGNEAADVEAEFGDEAPDAAELEAEVEKLKVADKERI